MNKLNKNFNNSKPFDIHYTRNDVRTGLVRDVTRQLSARAALDCAATEEPAADRIIKRHQRLCSVRDSFMQKLSL
jgi:hypothetical protein